MVTLENMVREDLINLDLKARTKQAAVEEIAGLLCAKEIVKDKAAFAKAVLLGDNKYANKNNGIALVSGTSDTVSCPAMAIGRLEKSIDWEDFGEGVDIIAVIAVPPDDIDIKRLKIMELLSELFNNITVVSDLYNLNSAEEIAESLINGIDEI